MKEKERLDITTKETKELAKEVYNDMGKPIAKPTGSLLGLIPRTIKAALAPLEKWVLQREYNIAETKKLLEEKLKSVSLELIETPEPHIAVPAMQYISYCMNNEELRDMYANLLANSMNKIVKNGVHPSFVEIIKQLCPDEAKILRYIYKNPFIPTISMKVKKKNKKSVTLVDLFTNITDFCGCEYGNNYKQYIDNLMRLGLLIHSTDMHLVNRKAYTSLKTHSWIVEKRKQIEKLETVLSVSFDEGYMELTAFGQSFCAICLEVVSLKEEKENE